MISTSQLKNLFRQESFQGYEKGLLIFVAALFSFLVVYPFWADAYGLSVMRDALIMSIFALSLDFLWGQTGLLSFGHSAFFGVGAYSMALLTLKYGAGSLTGLIAAMLAAAVVAFTVGYFLIYAGVRREYFAIVTLALALVGQQMVLTFASISGGDSGLIDVPSLSFGFFGFDFSFESDTSLYLLALGSATVVLIGLWILIRGNYGKTVRAIGNNEQRAQALGHNTSLHLLLVFTGSAFLAGLSGAIFTSTQGLVTPELIGSLLSTEVIIWVAIGGRGTLIGPMIGCFLVLRMRQEISSISTTLWPLILGVFFVLVVFVMPGGIMMAARWIGTSRVFRGSKSGTG